MTKRQKYFRHTDGVISIIAALALCGQSHAAPSDEGDKTPLSVARISFPIDGSAGTINTAGNATVSNDTLTLPLSLRNNQENLKVASPSGAYARAKIGIQRDTQKPYFDFIFGIKGKKEIIVDGRKNRAHVTLFPDGNGKFLRLDGDDGAIEIEQDYCAADKIIIPRHVKIHSPFFPETLVAEFEMNGWAVELARLYFK